MANPITPLRPVTGPARYRPLEKRAPAVSSPELGPRLGGAEAPRLPQALTQMAFAVGHAAYRGEGPNRHTPGGWPRTPRGPGGPQRSHPRGRSRTPWGSGGLRVRSKAASPPPRPSPIFLELPLHRRRLGVLELEPVARAAGRRKATLAASKQCPPGRACRRAGGRCRPAP
jgi:hypothetical protein